MTLKRGRTRGVGNSKRINSEAHIIWGSRIEENIKKSSMRVLIVLGGVKFPKFEYRTRAGFMRIWIWNLIG